MEANGKLNEIMGPTKKAFRSLTEEDFSKVIPALESYVTRLRTSIGTQHEQEVFLNQLRGGVFEVREQALRLVAHAGAHGSSLPAAQEAIEQTAKEAAWKVRNAFVEQIESMFAAVSSEPVAPSGLMHRIWLGNKER